MIFPMVQEIRFETDEALFRQSGFETYAHFMAPDTGTHVARKRGRVVRRLDLEGRSFFLKRNRFHWIEFFKGLLHMRFLPRNGLREWRNIDLVTRAGIPTVRRVAWGERRCLSREISSFTITEELYGARSLKEILQERAAGKADAGSFREKRDLIQRVARLASRLHRHGLYHQDFYLGHIYKGPDEVLYLIDLQRVLCSPLASRRYRIKDLAQIHYSAMEIPGISASDRLRFLLAYTGSQRVGREEREMIQKILAKTGRIARHTVKLLERRRRRKEIP